MQLNDLLIGASIDPKRTLILRHRPTEPAFRKVLPHLAGEHLELLNAYQSYQGPILEKSIQKLIGGWIVALLAHGAGRAIYVGTYLISGAAPETRAEFWARPDNLTLRDLGCGGFTDDEGRDSIVRFDLRLTDALAEWRGKLIVGWPPPERGWYRRAANDKNIMPVLAIREESAFSVDIPDWREMDYSWAELAILPERVRTALAQWRGIYLIWDESDGKSYVGSAYGAANILGRWENYAATGHGGNTLLRQRDPRRFRFTILQRVSPDLEDRDVISLESSWKARLHTRAPFGLNEN